MNASRLIHLTHAVALTAALTACEGDTGPAGAAGISTGDSRIALSKIGSFRNPSAGFDESAAEIVAFDPSTAQLFVVNAQSGAVDVVALAAPDAPTLNQTLDVAGDVAAARSDVTSPAALGAANSVAVHGGVLAVAIQAEPKTDPGYVAFYQTADTSLLAAVQVGVLPDMVTFAPDGSLALTANEGEPSDDYTIDPAGTISVIDLAAGASVVLDGDVTELGFDGFTRETLVQARVRLPRPFGASVAQDMEPEYIAVAADSETAWAVMQENSAIAEIDLRGPSITQVWGTGTKDFSLPGSGLDPSNRDDTIAIRNWPVRGLLMPDAVATFSAGGRDYLLTANEGDGREYIADAAMAGDCSRGLADFDDGECLVYLDEIRIRDIVDPGEVGASIDSAAANRFPQVANDSDADGIADLYENENLGRLKVIATEGLDDPTCLNAGGQPTAACSYNTLVAFGGRSFSIFDAQDRQLVYDSGSDFEVITAQRLGSGGFNATNDENGGDDRSDDKGPEPEALALGRIAGRNYAFVGLERVGGVMVYDISNPEAPQFVQYVNPRDFSEPTQNPDGSYNPASGDLGPEGIVFVPASDSPDATPLLLVGNEVSGTTAVYRIQISMP